MAMMHTPYSCTMLFLTYTKGDKVENWTAMMMRDINHQVWMGILVNEENLWEHVFKSFRRQYADMQEWERAEDILHWGIKMQGRNLDNYIPYFKMLTNLMGYVPNNQLCLRYFTDRLPPELYKSVVSLDWPRNFTKGKEAALN